MPRKALTTRNVLAALALLASGCSDADDTGSATDPAAGGSDTSSSSGDSAPANGGSTDGATVDGMGLSDTSDTADVPDAAQPMTPPASSGNDNDTTTETIDPDNDGSSPAAPPEDDDGSAVPDDGAADPTEDDGAADPTEDDGVDAAGPSNGGLAVVASSGCSASAPAPAGRQTLSVDGAERSYIVSLPEAYDPTTPYPLVFAFHGLGGSGELVSGRFYFGLEEAGGTPSIFVYPDGLETGNGPGWANTDGQDVAFFDSMFATLQDSYCVDTARVFSTGHSYGGIMSHTLGCERGDVLRAIAPVAGAHFGRRECSGPIAAWGAHGNPDNTVSYDSGLSAIQRVMDINRCDPDSATPVEPADVCVAYTCDAGYPVTWCAHDQDHDWPSFAAESIRAFFASF